LLGEALVDGAGLVKSFNASPAGNAAAAVMQELTTPVRRRRLTVSKPVLEAPTVSALGTII
jgi:hypothetical protein